MYAFCLPKTTTVELCATLGCDVRIQLNLSMVVQGYAKTDYFNI